MELSDILGKDPILDSRWTASKYSARTWLRTLPKNGYSHSESIERYLDKIITDDVKEGMSAAAVFVLLYAKYLHDLGKN